MRRRSIASSALLSIPLLGLFIVSCDDGGGRPAPGQTGSELVVDKIPYDADGDGIGGVYDCDAEDATLPAACPLAEVEPGEPVWCDDGQKVPQSMSLMNWVNHVEIVDGREKGLREYLYDTTGQDSVPDKCDLALLAMRGGPQDANTEQLTRYVIEGLDGGHVGYVLGGRSFWPHNADHWDFPNHAIDTSCASADGRTRLKEVHESCTTAIALRRVSQYDPCGSQYEGHAFLVGGGQSIVEYPKANLIRALEAGIAKGLFGAVDRVLDIDDQHWSNACRASLGARGCCHVANRAREHSGHDGVQLIIPTEVLKFGPICKNPDDLLHKYECSDLSSHPPLQALGDLLREVINQGSVVEERIQDRGTPKDLEQYYPLSEEALLAVLHSGWKDKDIVAVLAANMHLSDRVLLEAAEVLEDENWTAEFFVNVSPLSQEVLLSLSSKMKHHEFLWRILAANSDALNDTIWLTVIESTKPTPKLIDLLTAHCPLSPPVLEAAKRSFAKSKHDLERLEQCR